MIKPKYNFLMVSIILTIFFGRESLAQINYNQAGWGVDPMEYSRVGTAGFQFLKLPTNARNAGMGGVLAAAGYGDARSAFTNPASTADVKNTDLLFSTMTWVADIQYSNFSVVRNLNELGFGLGCVGLNLSYLNYGSMVRTENRPDDYGNILPVTEGLGTFSAYDLAVGVLYSQQITDQLQIGGNVRFVQEKIDDAKTSTWSFDIGTLYQTGIGSLRISMLGRNFGPDAEYDSYQGRIARSPVQIRMPMMFVLGAAYDILEMKPNFPHRLSIASEYIKPNDGKEKVNLGLEYFFLYNFYLRGGYRFNYDEERFTFGLGFEYSIDENLKIKLDYAYLDTGRFNQVNILTAGFEF
jgi:hypothetical protein